MQHYNYETKVTVLIPTKNGGFLFQQVITAILEQETPWNFEILVIDSGSKDGTVEFCQSLGDKIRFHSIPPEEFGHGKTRNLGVSMCTSEFVALLTHDALPANSHWLHNLVTAVEQAPDVAGAFGRHLPYPGGNPFVARDLKQHFDGFLNLAAVVRMDEPKRYVKDFRYRQLLHFFSNNNACIRRSVWEKIPYPDVDFAEDQIWAKQIIEAGYAKAYADDAAVFHSHDYSIVEYARRSFDEATALYDLFGYRLCPSVLHLLFYFYRCTTNDLRYSIKNNLLFKSPSWVVRVPFLNFARQIGYYFGERAHKFPHLLKEQFSLDKSIKKRKLGKLATQQTIESKNNSEDKVGSLL